MVRLLAVLLLLAATASAGPADSLTGIDMLAEHAARRAAVARDMGQGLLVLFAPTPPAYHLEYRPEPNLYWLTGVTRTNTTLVIHVSWPEATAASRTARLLGDRMENVIRDLRRVAWAAANAKRSEFPSEVKAEIGRAREAQAKARALFEAERGTPRVVTRLYLPERRRGSGSWTKRLLAGPGAAAATGIDDVRSIHRLYEDLGKLLGKHDRLYTLSDPLLPVSARDWLDRLVATRANFFRRSPAVIFGRARHLKSPEEIARIRRACELTATGLTECMQHARPGMFEYELQARLEFACRRGGARRQAFASIVGSGPNGTILHYMNNDRQSKAGDLVLMDVGAEYRGYAADITRTFPVTGRFTERQAKVYDVVLKAQRAALAAVKPGADFGVLNRAAREVIGSAGFGRMMFHSVGHYVGLDVHDPSPRKPFAPGTVITVEPGIYLVDEGIGIRIEDTVLVTKDGREVLSHGVVKERRDIEKLMR